MNCLPLSLNEITLTLTFTLLTLTLKSLSFFSSAAFISSLCFWLLVSFFSLLHVVWVNKNSFEFCLLPQLLFLIWTLPSIVSLYSFLPKFYCPLPQRFLLSYRCRFISTFERLLLKQSTFKAFKVSFFSLLYVVDVSSVHLHPHFAPITNTSSLHLPMFICFYRFLQRLVYGDNGVWFVFHYETCGKKNVFGRCKGCSQ